MGVTRLLKAVGPSHDEHVAAHGPLPGVAGSRLVEEIEASGLLGRGGAGFPTGRKLRTVAAGSNPVVLGNACEGEPGSSKDGVLLRHHPHLVLDGLQVAARAVGAKETHLAVKASPAVRAALATARGERRGDLPLTVHEIPAAYVASEESALVNFVNTGVAKPTFTPPRPFEKGIRGRPTLVNNAETLAHLALVARHGAAWFRDAGDPGEPGTMLVTVSAQDIRRVVEVETGTSVDALLRLVKVKDAQAVLVGGYFGTWVSAEQARGLALTQRDLRALGGALGAGVVMALPAGSCGLVETARVATYLAHENAGQCGPCLNGLPAIAGAVSRLAAGPWQDSMLADLDRWLTVVPGRGACRHPDGAVRFVLSGLQVFADDVARHRRGMPCAAVGAAPFLPVPRAVAA